MYLCGLVVVAVADVADADVVAVSDWWETILSCVAKNIQSL